jgi:hypothetical protein
MKKGLLLSVIASSFVFAGGVVVPPPAEPEPAMWTFGGQLVGYYQTQDQWGTGDLFTPADTTVAGNEGVANADVGIQLRANGDLGYGFGVGFVLNGLTTFGLETDPAAQYGAMQLPDATAATGAWISQAYMTYVMDNTTVKVGRQELPKALSPFAFSETWNVFTNTFEAAVVINGDLPDTTLVGAWVNRANANGVALDMNAFNKLNGDDGVFMLTAQNKSIEGLTLTGSFYYAANFADNHAVLSAVPALAAGTGNEAMIVWGDANYAMGDYYVAVQGGSIMDDDLATAGSDNLTGFGAKIGGTFGMFGAEVAYSSVDENGVEGVVTMTNFGGVKTPLYTQMVLNQGFISWNSDTIVAKVTADTEYGKFGIAYDMTTYRTAAAPLVGAANVLTDRDYTELDVTYSTKIGESTDIFAAFVMQDNADFQADPQNTVRVWARYNF